MSSNTSDRVPLKEVVDIQKEENFESDSPTVSAVNDTDLPEYHEAARFFELDAYDRRIPHISEKVMYLTNWALGEANGNMTEALLHLKGMKRFMSSNVTGKTLVDRMYRFARLSSDMDELSKKMQLLRE